MPERFDCPVCGAEIEKDDKGQTGMIKSTGEQEVPENHLGFNGKIILDDVGFVGVNYDNITKLTFIKGDMYIGGSVASEMWAIKGKLIIQIEHGVRRFELADDFYKNYVNDGSFNDAVMAEFWHDGIKINKTFITALGIGPTTTKITVVAVPSLYDSMLEEFEDSVEEINIFEIEDAQSSDQIKPNGRVLHTEWAVYKKK